jgi:hypothetical protein
MERMSITKAGLEAMCYIGGFSTILDRTVQLQGLLATRSSSPLADRHGAAGVNENDSQANEALEPG